MDYSPPGFSVHGISQARILEWVAMPSSRGSSQPRDRSSVSCIGRRILYHWATREAHHVWLFPPILLTFQFVDCLPGCAKALQFNVVSLVYFNLIAYAFGVLPKKSLPTLMSEVFFPCDFFGSFMISSLRFKSLIYFELIFVSGVR